MRILIIEDNAIQALALEMIMKRLGFSQVEKAYSAKQAHEILENFQPQLMLVDINLGCEETGVDIVKKVQKKNSVQVLYISGNTDSHHKKIADTTKYIGYLVKPIDPFKLEEILVNEEIFFPEKVLTLRFVLLKKAELISLIYDITNRPRDSSLIIL